MTSSSRKATIALWGASSVGKSTALAAYSGHYEPKWVDRADANTLSTERNLRSLWFSLKKNELSGGTSSATHYEFRHVDGGSIVFRDMVGGVAAKPTARADVDALRNEVAGALLFVDVTRLGIAEVRQSALNALAELGTKPCALVLTKCEAVLSEEEFGRFTKSPLSCEQIGSLVLPSGLMKRFESNAIFPITVYGWHNNMPAQYLDEFGRFVPFKIEPSLVDRPFEFAVERIWKAFP
ncbi:MAG: hypothetical protein WC815_04100 [Vicinamibacterales bacterium]|jgi:GTPase SAR1 family protein